MLWAVARYCSRRDSIEEKALHKRLFNSVDMGCGVGERVVKKWWLFHAIEA